VFVVVDVGLKRCCVYHVFGKFTDCDVDDVKEDIAEYYTSWWRWLGVLDKDHDSDTRISVIRESDLNGLLSQAAAVEYRDIKSIK
jgi:hypothetical protein